MRVISVRGRRQYLHRRIGSYDHELRHRWHLRIEECRGAKTDRGRHVRQYSRHNLRLGLHPMSTTKGNSDYGLSLIELVVYVLVSSVLLLATSAILVNSWTTQQNVTNVTDATNRGQVITSTVERAMRNAIAFDVSLDGTTLRVHTSLPGALACQGFYLANGESRMSISSSALAPFSAWSIWQPGVTQRGSTPFFAETGPTVSYTFDVSTTAAPVRFAGRAAARSAATGVSAPCW